KSIYASQRPIAAFSYTKDTACQSITLNFTAKNSLRSTYLWNFGDGSYDTARITRHTYTNSSHYVVSLTASNGYCDSLISDTIKIKLPDAPLAAFTFSQKEVCVNAPLQIMDSSEGKELTYLFTTSDSSYTIPSPVLKFKDTGTAEVKLIIHDRYGCSDSVQKSIKVLPLPIAGFTIKDSATSCHRRTYSFENASQYSSIYYWSFGDGSYDTTAENIQHTYTKSGSYTIKLVSSNGYCEDTFSRMIHVKLRPEPKVSFKLLSDSAGCAPFTLKWISKTENTDSLTANYDYTREIIDQNDTWQHTYNSPGTYVFWLRALTKEGCGIPSRQVIIHVFDSLSARISADVVQGCSPLTVHLENKGYIPPGSEPQFFWSSPAGSSIYSNTEMTFHSEKDTAFTVKLTIKAGSCRAEDSLQILVHSLNPNTDKTSICGATVEQNKIILVQWHKLRGAALYEVERSKEGQNFSERITTPDTFFYDDRVDVHT
ncbi:MAG TPA: PKD domain-containing protein, partial [Allocoleopsis sp.]